MTTDDHPTLHENDDPWPHETVEVRMLGRKRSLIASAGYSHMILLDDGGGVDPTREDLFKIIEELAERIVRIERIVG